MVIAPGLVLGAYLKEPLLRSEGEGGQEGEREGRTRTHKKTGETFH